MPRKNKGRKRGNKNPERDPSNGTENHTSLDPSDNTASSAFPRLNPIASDTPTLASGGPQRSTPTIRIDNRPSNRPRNPELPVASSEERGRDTSRSRDRDFPSLSAVPRHHSPSRNNKPPATTIYQHTPSRENQQMEISDNMSRMTVVHGGSELKEKIQPMRRPGYGKAGRPIKVDTNFFKMRLRPDVVFTQYAVFIFQKKHPSELEPGRRKKGLRDGISKEEFDAQKSWVDTAMNEPIFFNRAVFNMFMARYGRELGTSIAYDGRSIAYAPRRKLANQFLNHDFHFTVTREGENPSQQDLDTNKTIDVKLRLEHTVDLRLDKILGSKTDTVSSVDVLACIDNVIAHSPMRKYVQVGRSFYNPSEATPLSKNKTGATVSAWRGFYQSARLSEIGLVLNVDESFTTFWNLGGRSLMELINEACNGKEPWRNRYELNDVANKLKALKMRAIHNGITYKFHGFSNKSADQTFFDSGGRRVSISEYFAATYNRRLHYGHLPCVKTHPKRDTYLPLEMLIVMEKQRMMGLLSPDQTAVMVRRASVRPDDKRKAALATMRSLGLNHDTTCRDFGVGVDEKLVRVNARVLPHPPIFYRDEKNREIPCEVRSGQWRSTSGMYQPAGLRKWAVINEANAAYQDTMNSFLRELRKAADRAHMPMDKPSHYNANRNQVHNVMRDVLRDFRKSAQRSKQPGSRDDEDPLHLILIVKQNQDAQSYNKIKYVGDVEMGIPSQVVLARNLKNPRGMNMFCDNVMMKINAKLGGQNAYIGPYKGMGRVPDIDFLRTPHIILGADVTHPMPGGRTPSVAALVGSRDLQGIQYSASIRNQPPRQEVIAELGEMFKEVYKHWLKNFGHKVHTRKVIMFRDGVSEGQFREVMSKEVAQLRRACREMSEQCTPDITYIIVTKRHHTKFFPGRQDGDRNGNVLPGTVVDSEITSGEFYDFYLNSHTGIQGTNKPSKYTVLVDESNMSVDTLQGFVYRLSHGFVRCNRSVSMVNSAYYAHLMAFRGRAYLGDDGGDNSSVGSGEITVPAAPKIERHMARRLFFV